MKLSHELLVASFSLILWMGSEMNCIQEKCPLKTKNREYATLKCTKFGANGMKPAQCEASQCFTCEISNVKTNNNNNDDKNIVEYELKLTPIKLPGCDIQIKVYEENQKDAEKVLFDAFSITDPLKFKDKPSIIMVENGQRSTLYDWCYKFTIYLYNPNDFINIKGDENLKISKDISLDTTNKKILTRKKMELTVEEILLNLKYTYVFNITIPGAWNSNEVIQHTQIHHATTYQPSLECDLMDDTLRQYLCTFESVYDHHGIKIENDHDYFNISIQILEESPGSTLKTTKFKVGVGIPTIPYFDDLFTFKVIIMQTKDHKLYEKQFSFVYFMTNEELKDKVYCSKAGGSRVLSCYTDSYVCKVLSRHQRLDIKIEPEDYISTNKISEGKSKSGVYLHTEYIQIDYTPETKAIDIEVRLKFKYHVYELTATVNHTSSCDSNHKPSRKREAPNTQNFPKKHHSDIEDPYNKLTPNFNQPSEWNADLQITTYPGDVKQNENDKIELIQKPTKKVLRKGNNDGDENRFAHSVSRSYVLIIPVVIISVLGGMLITAYFMKKKKFALRYNEKHKMVSHNSLDESEW